MTGISGSFLTEQSTADSHGNAQWTGISKILGPPWANLPVIAISFLGAQILWSVQISYAPPYLLSLGLTKSWMAMVFLAGPLSGLIVQPLIGVLSDSSKSRFGRRRPYMMGGTVLCVGAVLLLGFTRPFAGIFTVLGTSSNDVLTVWFAVVSIFCIDFSVNAVQAMNRAILVDTLPASKQASGNAWAACMLSVGGMTGFFIGNMDLPHMFPFLGRRQLGVLSVIAAVILVSTQSLTMFCVKEKVLVSSKTSGSGFRHEIKTLMQNIVTLPRVIRQICLIQFFAWFAWYPTSFATVYIGELYKQANPLPSSPSENDILALDAEATRLGSRALFYNSVLSLASGIILPFLVARTQNRAKARAGMGAGMPAKGWVEKAGRQVRLASLWAFAHAVFALCMAGTLVTSSVFGVTVLMTITGFCWAVTLWAPSSLLGEAILTEPLECSEAGSIRLADARTPVPQNNKDEERQFLVGDDDEGDVYDGGGMPSRSEDVEAVPLVMPSRLVMDDDGFGMDGDDVEGSGVNESGSGGLSAKAGIILGIQNMFVVLPQFLGTALSSIIFAIFDPKKSGPQDVPANTAPDVNGTPVVTPEEGPNSIAILFRIGGVSAAIAFVMCWRLVRELKRR